MEGTGGGGAQLPCSYITTLAEHDALLHKAPDCSIPCTPSDCPWNTGAPTEPTHPAAQYATITLDYSVKDLPLAGIVGQLAGFFFIYSSNWVPTSITASSTVRSAPGSHPNSPTTPKIYKLITYTIIR